MREGEIMDNYRKKNVIYSRYSDSLRRMRIILLTFFVLIFIGTTVPVPVNAAGDGQSRVINLVYDDSGSMIYDSNSYVDTWCKAKYSLEVFAGMLGENDTLNVFYMSTHRNGGGKPDLILKGSDGAKANIEKVHNKVTEDGETPYPAVDAAKEYFSSGEAAGADEKWLVILTDGYFEEPPEMKDMTNVDKDLKSLPDDIQVMFLAMGPSVKMDGVNSDSSRGIYYEKAATSDEILKKLTAIGQQVFNRASLNVNNNKVSFDIPMKELIVFAQGENVSIKGIKSSDGKNLSPSEEAVNVQYSEAKDATTRTGKLREQGEISKTVDKNLRGSMATFRGNFAEGDYTLDVTGAKTIEVYYQPDVDIIATLKQGDEEVTDFTDLEAGEYTIDFDLVKGGTTEKIEGSSLLGEVTYEAVLNNNDNVQDGISKGSTVTIEEGPLSIDATAHYLEHYTVQTHLNYSIYKDKEITFTVDDGTVHQLSKKGFPENDQPTIVKALVDGQEPTPEQWAEMDVPSVKAAKKAKGPELEYRIEKSDSPGIYNVYPVSPEKLKHETYDDRSVSLEYSGEVGKESWAGTGEGTIRISDNRSWIDKHLKMIVISLAAALLLILILGYVPGIKHYLPKKLKKRPLVRSKIIGSYMKPPKPTNGQYTKKTITTFLPYVAEKGSIRYVPKGIAGAPKLQVKGAKGGRMEVTNFKEFGKKKNIQFDGERADRLVEDTGGRKFIASSGLTMTSEINGVKYTCSLNE